MSYHNTVPLDNSELIDKQFKAGSQDRRVLNWIRKYPDRYCPGQIYLYSNIFDPTKPQQLNSARRAVSNLTKAGLLYKTSIRVKCPVTGETVSTWELPPDSKQQGLF